MHTLTNDGALDNTLRSAVERFRRLLEREYDVEGIIVFGSQARGTAGPGSDVDVAVILRGEPRRFLATKLDMIDPAYEIYLKTGVDISPLPVWMEEWANPHRYPNPALLHDIGREGIRL